MNPQHTDYSLALGVFSAVVGLCIMLTVWYAVKASWNSFRKSQFERLSRKQGPSGKIVTPHS
jgi:hypothetical protein